ncbi:MAG: integrase core domain-containing protein [Tepidisphaeraceae bacterium]
MTRTHGSTPASRSPRDELLNAELFQSPGEAKHHAARWRREYNDERPHGALGYLTPSEFAEADATPQPMEEATHEATLRVTIEELPSGRHLPHPPMSEAAGIGVDEAGTITRLS